MTAGSRAVIQALFLYALCNGWIQEGTTVVEASSGSTAVSEAYVARVTGRPAFRKAEADQIAFFAAADASAGAAM